MSYKNLKIVWFKRDLRVSDHEPLLSALNTTTSDNLLLLYILEPEFWRQPDMSLRQYQFLLECLESLKKALNQLGMSLVIRVGDAKSIFAQIHSQSQIDCIFSHQETWNQWVSKRNKAMSSWFESQNIQWYESQCNGVVKHLKSRDGWAKQWYDFMQKPLANIPQQVRSQVSSQESDMLPEPGELGLVNDGCQHRQKGGSEEAWECLESFLFKRGEGYTKEMSSPVTAVTSCSRISPHIAFGTISMREVFQATEQRVFELREQPKGSVGKWLGAMRSFSARLRWHCHFIQKLEDEPSIEYANMHPMYNGLREDDFNEALFEAWKYGKTGYPMVDACMRSLIATGWLNFRMRAMLVSFASYHLWLDWRKTSKYLATLFTDYEPGIHYSQFQMQSGTTGINTLRIYNPIKQGFDQDPSGVFIRKWIPEIAHLEDTYIHTPWESGANIPDYPAPVVDEKVARVFAREKLSAVRKQKQHKVKSQDIVRKHGSRKRTRKSPKKGDSQQGELPLE
ncbi:MAG: deoxyribodipyrimidine photo-lyase [Pseudomonadota bacterium]|nr:deoxyribodipyrimidine photo-lyase [Pseudomonadota bacterium]